MLLSFLRSQWRVIRRRKIYYVINILGLALGMASTIYIVLWINDEKSYETMHDGADRICQLYKNYEMGGETQVNPSLPMPLAATLKEEFPEILQTVRLVGQRSFVTVGDVVYNEDDICVADPSYFKIFTFPFVKGDPRRALDDPYSIVLTEEKARKYFGDKDPMGKTLLVDGKTSFTVTGIMEDFDSNTDLDFQMVIPLETIFEPGSENDSWYTHFLRTYVVLEAQIERDSLNPRLSRHIKQFMSEDDKVGLQAVSLKDIYLDRPGAASPRKMYVQIFSVIGFLVLLIACINFTNVSTFVSLTRSREIGVKKINGGGRGRLVSQYFMETLFQTLASFILAMVIVEILRPQFNQLTGKSIVIPFMDPWFIAGCMGIILLTTLLAGTYPALLISAFSPMDAFRGRITAGRGQARFRTSLLVFQFAVSAGLIITTLTIYSQIGYMQKKNLGFPKENLLYLSMENAQHKNFEVFRQKLVQHNQIKNVCRTSSLPTSVWNILRGMSWEGQEEGEISAFSFISGDFELIETLGLDVIKGRDFDRSFFSDSSKILINEDAARLIGQPDPVGKYLLDDSTQIEIIGMFRDFHGLPLTEPIEPMIICMWPDMYYYSLIRLDSGNPQEAIDHIEEVWKSIYPDIPFEFNFMDARIENQYRSETRMGRLAGVFTILAILITCIGLFATSGHSARRREREMGIRKALGASSGSVIRYFIMDYLKWILVANVLAWPLSWLLMRNWLENFAYRTSVNGASFVLTLLVSLLISILTIGWHAWNTSRTNPVEILKYE